MLFRIFGVLTVVLLCAILYLGMCAGRVRAERQFIAEVEKALFCYQMDFGQFPAPAATAECLRRHEHNPYYLRLCKRWPARAELVDHWRRPLCVRPGGENPRLVDVYSLVPNGRDERGRGGATRNWP